MKLTETGKCRNKTPFLLASDSSLSASQWQNLIGTSKQGHLGNIIFLEFQSQLLQKGCGAQSEHVYKQPSLVLELWQDNRDSPGEPSGDCSRISASEKRRGQLPHRNMRENNTLLS